MTSSSQPQLLLLSSSDQQPALFSLSEGTCWTFGRTDDNTFMVKDPWISRNHAMVQSLDTAEFYLIDLGSRNGSFINGQRVSVPMKLQDGDLVTLGQTEFRFSCPHKLTSSHCHLLESDTQGGGSTEALRKRHLITVLVVDIRDFTLLARQLDQFLLSELIGTWCQEAGEIIRKHGCRVDKYIGDAIMAAWIHRNPDLTQGASTRDELLHTFLALQELEQMSASLHQRFTLPFPLRIGAGINTGYGMVGNTGSGDRPDYTVLGDSVNAAFRLETATKQMQQDIAIGETTYHYARYLLNINAVPFEGHQVHLKGYDEPTWAYGCKFTELQTFLQHHRPDPNTASPTHNQLTSRRNGHLTGQRHISLQSCLPEMRQGSKEPVNRLVSPLGAA